MGHNLETHQQRYYESAYQYAGDEFGFPDPKISDQWILRKQRVLGLGAGTGNDAWYLAKENLVVALDFTQSGLLVGKTHGLRCVEGDLNLSPSLPFMDRSFDVVICKDILEHLLEPLTVLQEVNRVLKDDGYVVISVPNHFYLPMRMRILFGKGLIWRLFGGDHSRNYDEWNYMHIRFFTYKGFCSFLKMAALRPEKWVWDFGNLAHYRNPDMWLAPKLWRKVRGLTISRRGKVGLYVIRPLWRILNVVFPVFLRRALVSLAPGLLCAGFYVRTRKGRVP